MPSGSTDELGSDSPCTPTGNGIPASGSRDVFTSWLRGPSTPASRRSSRTWERNANGIPQSGSRDGAPVRALTPTRRLHDWVRSKPAREKQTIDLTCRSARRNLTEEEPDHAWGRIRQAGPAGRAYRKGHLLGPLWLLKTMTGSVAPRVLPWALLAIPYTVCMRHYVFSKPQNELIAHPYAYQFILLTSGFCLVFRLNQSLTRYWEARSAAQNASSKWFDGLAMLLAFDENDDSPDDPSSFQSEEELETTARFGRSMLHLFSLLHALACVPPSLT